MGLLDSLKSFLGFRSEDREDLEDLDGPTVEEESTPIQELASGVNALQYFRGVYSQHISPELEKALDEFYRAVKPRIELLLKRPVGGLDQKGYKRFVKLLENHIGILTNYATQTNNEIAKTKFMEALDTIGEAIVKIKRDYIAG